MNKETFFFWANKRAFFKVTLCDFYIQHWHLGAYWATAYYLDRLPFDKAMTIPLKVSWFLSELSTVFSICVSTAYWSKGYQGEVIDLDNILKHIMNTVMVLMDLFIVKHPHRFSHFIYSLIFGSNYVFFNFAYTKSRHWWPIEILWLFNN